MKIKKLVTVAVELVNIFGVHWLGLFVLGSSPWYISGMRQDMSHMLNQAGNLMR